MNHKDEKLLREFVRRTIVQPAVQALEEEKRKEDSVRLWVRSHIREFIEKDYNLSLIHISEPTRPY